MRLDKQRVLVLGGSAGLGLATAQAAAAEGASVVIVSSRQERLDGALASLPAGSMGFAVDLSLEKNIKTFFDAAGDFDHLVYTAGENLHLSPLEATELSSARQFFNVRFWGAAASVRYGAPHIRPGGSIGLVGGIAGARPRKGWGYAAGICAAMEGFTRAMAVELAPLRVNQVSPGIVRTGLWGEVPEQFFEETGKALPVGRVGEAEDIARAFVYLMTQGFCTGQVLVVDGGAVLV